MTVKGVFAIKSPAMEFWVPTSNHLDIRNTTLNLQWQNYRSKLITFIAPWVAMAFFKAIPMNRFVFPSPSLWWKWVGCLKKKESPQKKKMVMKLITNSKRALICLSGVRHFVTSRYHSKMNSTMSLLEIPEKSE